MDVEKPSVADILVNPKVTYKIPPYQRGYGWQSDRWQSLIQDIINKITSPEKQHWMGIVITSPSEDPGESRGYMHKYLDVIDGQQRIVTLRLWLQALIDHANENTIRLSEENDIEFAELICQETDKLELKAILDGHWRIKWKKYKANSSGLLHCYTYFRWVLWLGNSALLASDPDQLPEPLKSEEDRNLAIEKQWEKILEKREEIAQRAEDETNYQFQYVRSQEPDIDALIKVTLSSLSLVELQLDKERDEEPADIFEALNGKRLELDQFDHVRNFIFSGISDREARRQLYDDNWKHYELALGKSSQTMKNADTFLYDYLISRGETKFQKSFSKQKTSRNFVKYFNSRTSGNHVLVSNDEILPSLAAWLSVKSNGENFEIKSENYGLEPEAKKSLRLMDALSSGPLVPILMNLANRYFAGLVTKESLQRQYFALEVFLGRTVLNRVALSPLRSDMMSLSGKLGPNFSEDELISNISEMLPKDSSIKEKLTVAKVNQLLRYPESATIADTSRKGFLNSRQMLALFQAYESESEGPLRRNLLDSDAAEKFSIEHIYPQEDILWRDEIRQWGVSGPQLEARLHTIGNLAVIPARLNSKLSNKSFREKRTIMKDPREQVPKINLNTSWTSTEQTSWKPDDIDRRASHILSKILSYWSL